MKTAINNTSNWGGFLKRPEHVYPVYQTNLTVPTEIEELRSLPAFLSAASISELVQPFEELMGLMNPTSYGPTEVGRYVISGLGLPRRGFSPRGFCSPTHGATARAPTKRLPHMTEVRGRREQYPLARSAQTGNIFLTEVSHSSPSGG